MISHLLAEEWRMKALASFATVVNSAVPSVPAWHRSPLQTRALDTFYRHLNRVLIATTRSSFCGETTDTTWVKRSFPNRHDGKSPTRTPLIIRTPNSTGARCTRPVSLVDLHRPFSISAACQITLSLMAGVLHPSSSNRMRLGFSRQSTRIHPIGMELITRFAANVFTTSGMPTVEKNFTV